MPNITDPKKKKRLGAVVSALVMGGLFLMLVVSMLLEVFGPDTVNGDRVLLLISVLIGLAPVIGIALALGQRMKEIEGGEEDEARKY